MSEDVNITLEVLQKTFDYRKIDSEFDKPIFDNIFFRNLSGLLKRTKSVKFNKSNWKYSPKQFCLDYYGSDFNFDKIIMLINNIGSVFDFKEDNFKNRDVFVLDKEDIYKTLAYS